MAPSPLQTPPSVDDALTRGRKSMRKDAPKRRLCMHMEKGDTYHYLNGRGVLDFQPTVTAANQTGKPPHRIRNVYNFIRPIVEAKVSAATQRVPSYEILPTTTDQSAISAAKLAERVARYGYDQWRVRNVSLKVVKLAIAGGGDGFALPYFDPNVGPYRQVGEDWVGQGEVKILVLNGNEVFWEDGVDFAESPWWAIERARTNQDVRKIPGYIGGDLTDNASTDTGKEATENKVMVTEYFERPSPQFPDGRCMTFAGGRPVVDYRLINPLSANWWGAYPLQDTDGTVLDEPILHRLSYTVDADTDRDFGLVWQLIDFQRTIQDAYNKLLEWKNRTLNPQMKAPVGSIVSPPDDVPGSIRYYRVIAGLQPEWERPPAIPQELFEIIDRAVSDMRAVASDQQVDPAPNLAARTLEAGIEQSQNRWQSFLGDYAAWHSSVMRHCLLLVSRHYTEPRLLQIQGRDTWALQKDFLGAHLMGQTQVRVLPGSLAPITRGGIQDQLTWINQNFPGYLTPEAALTAVEAGSLDRLTESYWLDAGKANIVIEKIVDGTVMGMPTRQDTMPDGSVVDDVPGYMPGPADNLNVWKQMVGNFLKTDSYLHLAPEMQTVANQVWSGIQYLEQQRAQQQAQLQNQMAEQAGMMNAAKPQTGKPMPSLPGSGQVPAPA